MKCITVLLDGASDRSYDVLGGLTPFQYAHTPNLDKIACESQCGLMTVLDEGLALGTDLAHMLLFGYREEEYPARSIVDAIGEKVDLDKQAVYLRCSFADVTQINGYKINARFTSHLSDREIQQLKECLTMTIKGCHFEFIHSYDSHGFIKITGHHLSDQVSDSDPFRNNQYVMKVEAFETDDLIAVETSEVINQYIKKTYDVLHAHEINKQRRLDGQEVGNILLTKWAGSYKDVEPFSLRNGVKGLLLGQSKLLRGLTSYIHMAYDEYDVFSEAVMTALNSPYDYVHLHTKAPDTAAHKKDPMLKVKTLEMLDRSLTPLLDFEGLLIVTSDHSTPCSGKAIHSGESVAFMAKGAFVRKDTVQQFNEIACAKGSIFLKGKDFMNYIINATDRGSMYHLRQGRKKRHYLLTDVNKLL